MEATEPALSLLSTGTAVICGPREFEPVRLASLAQIEICTTHPPVTLMRGEMACWEEHWPSGGMVVHDIVSILQCRLRPLRLLHGAVDSSTDHCTTPFAPGANLQSEGNPSAPRDAKSPFSA